MVPTNSSFTPYGGGHSGSEGWVVKNSLILGSAAIPAQLKPIHQVRATGRTSKRMTASTKWLIAQPALVHRQLLWSAV